MVKNGELRPALLIAASALLGWLWPLADLSNAISAVAYSAVLYLVSDALVRATRPEFDVDSVSAHAVGIGTVCVLVAHELTWPAVVGIAVAALVALAGVAESVARISTRRRDRAGSLAGHP